MPFSKVADRHGRMERPLSFLIWALILGVATIITLYAIGLMYVEVGTETANVKNFGDALWLGVMVISTVGFGDHYATTTFGRILTVFMVLTGPVVLGALFSLGQSLIKTDANITNRELMSILMELHRQVDELHTNQVGPTTVDVNSHGLDHYIMSWDWLNDEYEGWITLGRDNTGIYKIAIHANPRKVSGTPLVRHVYAGDSYSYALYLSQYYVDNPNVY